MAWIYVVGVVLEHFAEGLGKCAKLHRIRCWDLAAQGFDTVGNAIPVAIDSDKRVMGAIVAEESVVTLGGAFGISFIGVVGAGS